MIAPDILARFVHSSLGGEPEPLWAWQVGALVLE
jgi:hypothetical protein